MEPDIHLYRIALLLQKGHSESFICEGCSNRALYKDDDNKLYLAKENRETREIKLNPIAYHELMFN